MPNRFSNSRTVADLPMCSWASPVCSTTWACIFQENSLPQSNPGGIQIDRKRLEQLQEKREAHGLKGNVYEEYKGPTMSM